MNDYLTPTEKAQSAFQRFVKALPIEVREDIEQDAWANAFSVETINEYPDDLRRWEVALATAQMLADERGIEV